MSHNVNSEGLGSLTTTGSLTTIPHEILKYHLTVLLH